MIGNLALFALAGMVTLFGTLTTSGRLLLSATRVPPSGAGLAIAANPDAASPPVSFRGSNAYILSTRAAELCRAALGQGCDRRADFRSRVGLDDFKSGSPGKFRTLMDIPISGGGAMVRKAFDGSVRGH